jgi:uncharacterized membrane protein
MNAITAHVTRCFIAGIVALLPIGGMLLSIFWIESMISATWLANKPWYFPGMGLVLAALIIYLIGLTVSSLIGRWIWSLVDRLLHRLPLLGTVYATLKQIVGYGDGPDALFKQVVLVHNRAQNSAELGLVTNRCKLADGCEKVTVFLPFAATPTAGRLLLLDAADVTVLDMAVSEALKALVSVGLSPPAVSASAEGAAEVDPGAPSTGGVS